MGIPSKRGGRWSPGTVNTMLRNEAYSGSQWWGKCRFEKVFGEEDTRKRKVTAKPEEEWIRIEGYTPMIIEPAIHKAVQQVMDSKPRRGKQWNYVFSEFFACGECASSVCGATQPAGRHRNRTYPYYRCEGTGGGHYRPKICDLEAMRADKLEPIVSEHIMAAVENPEGIMKDLRGVLMTVG